MNFFNVLWMASDLLCNRLDAITDVIAARELEGDSEDEIAARESGFEDEITARESDSEVMSARCEPTTDFA
jgi:hypothetical protein